MDRLIFIVLSILASTCYAQDTFDPNNKAGNITVITGNGSAVICRQGTATASADGCAGQPINGNILHTNFFTSYALQSGQTYSIRPPWNVAGVDYPVGQASNATITIASPAIVTEFSHGHVAGDKIVFFTTGSLPTGVTAGTTYFVIAAGLGTNSYEISTSSGGSAVNTSGSQSGFHVALKDPLADALPSGCSVQTFTFQYVLCHSTGGNIVLDHWYFNDANIEVNGDCTSFTFTNNRYLTGAHIASNAVQFGTIVVDSGACSQDFENNLWDGNAQNLSSYNSPGDIVTNSTGAFTSKYEAHINTELRSFALNAEQTANVLIEFDYFDGMNFNNAGHGEELILSNANNVATTPSFIVSYTTQLNPSTFGGGYTAAWYFSGGLSTPNYVITSASYDHNITVDNLFGGVGGTVVGAVAALRFPGPAITSLSITANYIDPIGAQGNGTGGKDKDCFIQDFGSAVYTGNINLITGATVTDATPSNCHLP